MILKICKIPLPSPMTLDFGCTADQVIHLAVPKDVEITSTHMVMKGANFDDDVFSQAFGTTASAKTTGSDGYEEMNPDGDIPTEVTAIIIDFHTQRTITGLKLQEMKFDTSGGDLFCIIRVNSGGNWFLPTPKNLFGLGTITSPATSSTISTGLPEISTEKVLLTFATLVDKDGNTITHNQTNGNLYALGNILIKEQALTSIKSLSIFSSDFLTDFSIRVGDALPLFQPENEFFTHDTEYQLPDFTTPINQYMEDANPLSFEDAEILEGHPEFDYLKNLRFSLVPLTIHTERSGVLEISQLNLEYVRHHRASEKTLTFEPDPQRSGTITCEEEINIKDVDSIDFISMKLEGEFSQDEIIPSSDIQPFILPEANSTLGFQIIANKRAAQKVIISKPFKITGIDVPMKFLDKTVNYRAELRTDTDNQPGEKILAAKKMAHDSQSNDDQFPVKDFSWVRVDFEEEIQVTNGTYWLVVESIEGELVWQIAGQDGIGLRDFLYVHKDDNCGWQSLSDSYGKEVGAVYRMRHIPLDVNDPPLLRIKLNHYIIKELTRKGESIDTLLEEEVNISDLSGSFQPMALTVEAQSVGTLKISDLLIKYNEVPDKRVHINSFVETLCL
ncbi:MAG: hypothetical protein PVH61_20215 [Candidatus Aminicenantes bacterium]|jgi:hypothetical protein